MTTRRIEKKSTGFKDKSSLKINVSTSTLKKAPATTGMESEEPTRTVRNAKTFKKSKLIYFT